MTTKYKVTVTQANGTTKSRSFSTQEAAKAYREGITTALDLGSISSIGRVQKVESRVRTPAVV